MSALEIQKTDSITKEPLQYAKFKVERLEGTNTWVDLGEHVTNAKGIILLEDIDIARYRVTEVSAPDGYLIDMAVQEIGVEGGKKSTLHFENTRKNPIIINKVDEKTGEPLQGAEFRVTKISGELVGDYTTGAFGYITIPELDPGYYQVVETKAPDGYIISESSKIVQLKSGEPAVVQFSNKQLSTLRISKTDTSSREPLFGAQFMVTKKNGALIGEYETDMDGEIVVGELEPGWYTVTETQAPTGYMINSASKDIEITSGETQRIEFTNTIRTGIHISKTDAVTEQPMENVEFSIVKITGERVGDFATDEYGAIYSGELDPGWYVVTETGTVSGYKVDDAPAMWS